MDVIESVQQDSGTTRPRSLAEVSRVLAQLQVGYDGLEGHIFQP